MYGHLNMRLLPPEYPQFMASGQGSRVIDVDGREFVDLMCRWGPVILGHRHPVLEEAAARQASLGDCLNGPSPRMVELAECFVSVVEHAQWVMFQKNGTDATTLCCTIARADRSAQGPGRQGRVSRRRADPRNVKRSYASEAFSSWFCSIIDPSPLSRGRAAPSGPGRQVATTKSLSHSFGDCTPIDN